MKRTALKRSKLRQSAEGRECQIRIPGVCNFNVETTVLAHKNGGGMGAKVPDYQASFSCSDCHDVVDGRSKTHWNRELLRMWHYEGIFRTQDIWEKEGFLTHV